uniref:Secreted protein n=1 Tax=Arundo donax TaxID=35708 RepID=A0A0A9B216_ARUDO
MCQAFIILASAYAFPGVCLAHLVDGNSHTHGVRGTDRQAGRKREKREMEGEGGRWMDWISSIS